jgi:glutamate-ammonia-ligase adenylyltransferase
MNPLDYSRYAHELVAVKPELGEELVLADEGGWTREAMLAFVRDDGNAEEPHARLRQLRQRVMLRTMARDLADVASLEEVCGTMSTLAEVAIGEALAFLEPRMAQGMRRPKLTVVGMGKLGGGELNVSSDVDLVFLYPEEDASGGELDYFTRLGRRLIAALGDRTENGFVFRVDMRLRPWGDGGTLATSFPALEEYFVTQGREWERYAWIKARVLSGDSNGALAAIVRPFVYRKYLDYGTYAAMRELHAQIRTEVARRELSDQIKLGPGGIREIEFIAQAFQLIRGGRDPELQIRPTLAVLALLAQKGLLPAAAYRSSPSLRVPLEHRLQYLDDAQTHELPGQPEDRLLVARAMGFAAWDSFRVALDTRRARVSWHFEQLFSVEDAPKHALASLWTGENTEKRLAQLGFRDSAGAAGRLTAARSGSRYGALPEASRKRFDALIPRIIEESAARSDPDATLKRFLDLVETVSRRAAYLALLDEHPAVLARLAQVFDASSWAAEYLNRNPIVLDELLDARSLLAPPDWRAFAQELRAQLQARQGDEERQMDWLREAHHAQVFRLLAQDLSGLLSVEALADHLSDLADAMLQATLELCWAQLRTRHRDDPRFAIVAYGKLGGKELGYASDLDLIFPGRSDEDARVPCAPRAAPEPLVTARTATGVLSTRPAAARGETGLLVSARALSAAISESAWTWRPGADAERLCAETRHCAAFGEERIAILYAARRGETARGRAPMREQLLAGRPNASDMFDLKYDRGGMIDIEFVVHAPGVCDRHAESPATRAISPCSSSPRGSA